ncbi:MAG: signal transduction histidine kinase [Rickettsiales bacterium]|jgi:signal transduction histidine kinase
MDCQTRTLHFKDDGIGIAADQLEFIFDDFFTSNKKGGTGIGLPFCKRVMNSFGGDISCKSEMGKGAEFCLRF